MATQGRVDLYRWIWIPAVAAVAALAWWLFGAPSWDGAAPVVEETRAVTAEETDEPSTSPVRMPTPLPSRVDPVVTAPGPPPVTSPEELVDRYAERLVPRAPEAWIEAPRVVDRVVAAANAIVIGEDPLKHIGFARPEKGRFETTASVDGSVFLSDETPLRYRVFLDVIGAVDPALVAEAFSAAESLLDDSHARLGGPDDSFRTTVIDALRVLIDAPSRPEIVELESRGALWEYADPELRSLDPAERYLLRLDAADRKRIRRKLIEIERALSTSP